jgi:hypothetical protein
MGDREPERQNSKGAAEGNRMIGWGAYDRSINPGLRFPFEYYPSCNLPPGAATRHLRMNIFADAMSSHPYRAADFDILTADIGHIH